MKKATIKTIAAVIAVLFILPTTMICVSATTNEMSYEYWYDDNQSITGTLRRLATYSMSRTSTNEHYVQSLVRIEVTSSAPYTTFEYLVYSTAYYTNGTYNKSAINTGIAYASSSSPFFSDVEDARAYYNSTKTVSSILGHGEITPTQNTAYRSFHDIVKIAGVIFMFTIKIN